MQRIKTAQDSLLKNSIRGAEEAKERGNRNSILSSVSKGRRSVTQEIKVPPLKSPIFMQSDTDEADISDNGLRANFQTSHISMISPN